MIRKDLEPEPFRALSCIKLEDGAGGQGRTDAGEESCCQGALATGEEGRLLSAADDTRYARTGNGIPLLSREESTTIGQGLLEARKGRH